MEKNNWVNIINFSNYDYGYSYLDEYNFDTFIFPKNHVITKEQSLILKKNYDIANCKSQAKNLISFSDWSVLPDVNISNKSDFIAYRKTLRNLILNPVENPVFPVEPQPVWN